MIITRKWFYLMLATFLAGCQASAHVTNTPTGSVVGATATVQPSPVPSDTPLPSPIPSDTLVPSVAADRPDIFQINARLGRGINLGNALEAPNEGEWGVVLQAEYFQLIKARGFQAVRVPIRWSAHAAKTTPYMIDPDFMARIDWVVDQAQKNDLAVILNVHHYQELFDDPSGQRERFIAIWDQIARHFQAAPDTLVFELLNEPNGNVMTSSVWNDLAGETLETVRKSNPQRAVIIGPVDWNSVDRLDSLQLPDGDRNIIVTYHYYAPFHFTHQGAEWAEGSSAWMGTTWKGSDTETAAVRNDFDKAASWSEAHHRPIFLGEFGAYSKADMDSRSLWTSYVARQAEARNFSWAYWEFCSGFGIYDPSLRQFRQPLLTALMP